MRRRRSERPWSKPACRFIRQGPAHFTWPPVACRFAPIVWVPSYGIIRAKGQKRWTAAGLWTASPPAGRLKGQPCAPSSHRVTLMPRAHARTTPNARARVARIVVSPTPSGRRRLARASASLQVCAAGWLEPHPATRLRRRLSGTGRSQRDRLHGEEHGRRAHRTDLAGLGGRAYGRRAACARDGAHDVAGGGERRARGCRLRRRQRAGRRAVGRARARHGLRGGARGRATPDGRDRRALRALGAGDGGGAGGHL